MKYIYIPVGLLFLAIGAVGAVLPLLPTTPFLLITAFCFAKGSDRFHKWLAGTQLYKKYLESYVNERAMTLKTKLSMCLLASAMMLIAFFIVPHIPAKAFILAAMAFHWWYFLFCIKTK